MARLLILPHLASQAEKSNIKWEVRLEFHGKNEDNVSGRSDKFWECWSDGHGCYTNHGACGTGGLSSPVGPLSLREVQKRMSAKMLKGYTPVSGSHQSLSTSVALSTPRVPDEEPEKSIDPTPLSGPFAFVSRIECDNSSDDRFRAFDVKGNLVMILTADGARGLHRSANGAIQLSTAARNLLFP